MKVFSTEDTIPTSSKARIAEAAAIPPYTFTGLLDVGLSPVWSPHTSYDLTVGYIQARTVGTTTAGIAVLKLEGANTAFPPVVLGSVILQASQTKQIFSLEGGIITPYDSVYLASFGASGHEDVVVQVLGERIQ